MNRTNDTSPSSSETLGVKLVKYTLYAAVFVIGFGGNSMVIWIMKKKKKARTFHNILLCNLAVADIALLSVNLPFRLAYQETNYVWPFGQVLCKIIPAFTYLFLTTSSLTLVVITHERHRKMSSMTVENKPGEKRRAKLLIVFLWIVSCTLTAPLIVVLKVVKNKKGQPVCSDVWPSDMVEVLYFSFLFLVQFLLPVVVMVVMYCRIGLILHRVQSNLSSYHTTNNIARKQTKTVRLICSIVVMYILLTLPYHITGLMRSFGIKDKLAHKFSVLLLTATSAAHPIIYNALHVEFGKGFKAILCCSKKSRNNFLRSRFGTTRQSLCTSESSKLKKDLLNGDSRAEQEQNISAV